MKQAMISNYVRKIQPAKTIRFFHEKFQFFHRFFTHDLRLNCHASCPWQQRILLSKRTSRLYESHQNTCAALILREQSDFANFEVSSCQEKSGFHEISSSGTATGAAMQTLASFVLFPQPMDRAETLHTARYNIEDSWKTIPTQNDQVELCEKSTFPTCFPT